MLRGLSQNFYFLAPKKKQKYGPPTRRASRVHILAGHTSIAVAMDASDIVEFENAPLVYTTPRGRIVARPSQTLRCYGIGWGAELSSRPSPTVVYPDGRDGTGGVPDQTASLPPRSPHRRHFAASMAKLPDSKSLLCTSTVFSVSMFLKVAAVTLFSSFFLISTNSASTSCVWIRPFSEPHQRR